MLFKATMGTYIYDATRSGRHWTVRVNPWTGGVM